MIKIFILAFLLIILGANFTQAEVKMFPLPIRLNNPGAIKHSKDYWNGESRFQNDKHFVRFLTPQAGIRALMKIMLTYEDIYGLTTVRTIVSRYAPDSENNVEAYIYDVALRIGISQNAYIDMRNIDNLIDLAKAIIIHENGLPPDNMPPYWYEEVTYHEAAKAALEPE